MVYTVSHGLTLGILFTMGGSRSKRRAPISLGLVVFCVGFVAVTSSLDICPNGCVCTGTFLICGSDDNATFTLDRVPRASSPTNITHMSIVRQNIPRISRGDFDNYNKVEILILVNISMEVIEDGAFTGLDNLERLLILNCTQLQSVNALTFEGLDSLVFFSLRGNEQLVMEPCTLTALPKLETLNLAENPAIILTRDQLVGVGCENANYSSVKDLYLSDQPNEITPQDWSILPNLRSLSLDGAPESILNTTYVSAITNLASFTVKRLRMTFFPSNIFYNDNLNSIHILEASFIELPANAFVNTPKLARLDIDSSDLASIHPEAFKNLSNIYYLGLFRTNVQTLPPGLLLGVGGFTLELEENKLETLPPGILDGVTTVYRFALGGNPWICDCSLYWLIVYLREHPRLAYSDPVCAAPFNLVNVTFEQLIEDRTNMTGCEPPVTTPVPTTTTTRAPVTTTTRASGIGGVSPTDNQPIDPPEAEPAGYYFKKYWYSIVIASLSILIACCRLCLWLCGVCLADDEDPVPVVEGLQAGETGGGAATDETTGLRNIYTNNYAPAVTETSKLNADTTI